MTYKATLGRDLVKEGVDPQLFSGIRIPGRIDEDGVFHLFERCNGQAARYYQAHPAISCLLTDTVAAKFCACSKGQTLYSFANTNNRTRDVDSLVVHLYDCLSLNRRIRAKLDKGDIADTYRSNQVRAAKGLIRNAQWYRSYAVRSGQAPADLLEAFDKAVADLSETSGLLAAPPVDLAKATAAIERHIVADALVSRDEDLWTVVAFSDFGACPEAVRAAVSEVAVASGPGRVATVLPLRSVNSLLWRHEGLYSMLSHVHMRPLVGEAEASGVFARTVVEKYAPALQAWTNQAADLAEACASPCSFTAAPVAEVEVELSETEVQQKLVDRAKAESSLFGSAL